MGARALRFGVSWAETETSPGTYDWSKLDVIINTAHRLGMSVIPYFCYTPRWAAPEPSDFWAQPPRDPNWFAAFAAAAASRYRGKVLAWGLWNEPDNVYWKGTPGALAAMMIPAARAIGRADPAAGVWMGGLAEGADPFFRGLLASGAEKAVNAVGIHGYPETWDARAADSFYAPQLHAMRQALVSVHSRDDIWLDENGYSDYRYSDRSVSRDVSVPIVYAYEHTPGYQAVMLWREHVDVLASGLASLMGWYRIHDLPQSTRVIGDSNNRFLGLVDIQGREKPDFYALRFYDALFDQPTRSLDGKISVRAGDARDVVVHAIEKQNGDVVVTGWLARPSSSEIAGRGGRARDRRRPVNVQVQFPPGYHFSRVNSYRVSGAIISRRKLSPASSLFVLRDFVLRGDDAEIVVLSR